MKNPPPVVTLVVSKYRGPGKALIAERRPKVEATRGGKPFEPFARNRRAIWRGAVEYGVAF